MGKNLFSSMDVKTFRRHHEIFQVFRDFAVNSLVRDGCLSDGSHLRARHICWVWVACLTGVIWEHDTFVEYGLLVWRESFESTTRLSSNGCLSDGSHLRARHICWVWVACLTGVIWEHDTFVEYGLLVWREPFESTTRLSSNGCFSDGSHLRARHVCRVMVTCLTEANWEHDTFVE